jgi:hypothetical protein
LDDKNTKKEHVTLISPYNQRKNYESTFTTIQPSQKRIINRNVCSTLSKHITQLNFVKSKQSRKLKEKKKFELFIAIIDAQIWAEK